MAPAVHRRPSHEDLEEAYAALDDVGYWVQEGEPDSEIAERLGHLTNILVSGGAILNAGEALARTIITLAQGLGQAGSQVLQVFNLR